MPNCKPRIRDATAYIVQELKTRANSLLYFVYSREDKNEKCSDKQWISNFNIKRCSPLTFIIDRKFEFHFLIPLFNIHFCETNVLSDIFYRNLLLIFKTYINAPGIFLYLLIFVSLKLRGYH